MVLQKLRKFSKLFLWLVVAGFVGWIFFDLGANLVGKKVVKPWERGIIAEINGEQITFDTYNRLLQSAIQDSIKAKGGRELTDEEEAKIEESVFQSIVEDVMWRKIIETRRLTLDDNTIINLIRVSPPKEIQESEEFQTEGKFDIYKYQQALQNPQNIPFFSQYELLLRREIPKELMNSDVALSIYISETDAYNEFLKRNEKVKIEYIEANARNIPDTIVSVKEDEIQRFYSEFKDSLREPPMASFSIALFPKVPSKEDTLQALERINTALLEIEEGSPFEDIVNFYSEDDKTRESGGDMGWIKRRFGYIELYNTADTLKDGDISKPILTRKGYQVIKRVEEKGDSIHIKNILVGIRISPSTKERLRGKAENFRELAIDMGFDSAAKELNVELKELKDVRLDREYLPPPVGIDEEMSRFIKEGTPGEISEVIRRVRFYAVIDIKEKREPRTPPLEEVKEKVENKLMLLKKLEKAEGIMREVYNKLTSGLSFNEAIDNYQEYGLTVRKPSPFTRVRPPLGISPQSEFIGAAFGMREGEIIGPIKSRNSLYIIRLIERIEPNKEDFAKQKQSILNSLRIRYINSIYSNWIQEMKKNLEIKDYRSYILY